MSRDKCLFTKCLHGSFLTVLIGSINTCWWIHSFLTKNYFWILSHPSCNTGDRLRCLRVSGEMWWPSTDDTPEVGYTIIPVHREASAVPELLLCFSPCDLCVLQRHWLREAGLCTRSDSKNSGFRLAKVLITTLSVTGYVTLNTYRTSLVPVHHV